MMAPRQLRGSGQQVIQMAAPAGRVLAFAEALGLGCVQNLLDPSPDPGSGFGLFIQIGFRTASTSSVAMVSTGLARKGAA